MVYKVFTVLYFPEPHVAETPVSQVPHAVESINSYDCATVSLFHASDCVYGWYTAVVVITNHDIECSSSAKDDVSIRWHKWNPHDMCGSRNCFIVSGFGSGHWYCVYMIYSSGCINQTAALLRRWVSDGVVEFPWYVWSDRQPWHWPRISFSFVRAL